MRPGGVGGCMGEGGGGGGGGERPDCPVPSLLHPLP